MPSFFTVVSSLLLPAGAVLAASLIPVRPELSRRDGCVQTYTSKEHDTCGSIEKDYGLQGGAILAANSFLNCQDIWPNTPICIPSGGSTPSTPSGNCKSTYRSQSGDTCDKLDQLYNLKSGSIKGANSFVDCNNIWANTPLCIPDGPYEEDLGCIVQTYSSKGGDTCDSIEAQFALRHGELKEDYDYLDCSNIWANTPLMICVPSQADHGCTQTISSLDCDTCDDIGTRYGVSGDQIKAWNSFVGCNDIWTNTPICVKTT